MIDEKKLIKHLKNCRAAERDEWGKFDDEQAFGAMCAYDHIIEYIENSSKSSEWIPCSERLPKSFTPVFAQFADTDMIPFIGFINDVSKWSWLAPGGSDAVRMKVIAWQSLPEPWKGAESV